MPAEFHESLPDESPDSACLWHAWLTNQDRAAFDALFIRYLPAARIIARMLKRGNPDFYHDPVGDLVSDAVMAIYHFVQYQRYYDPPATIPHLFHTIRRQVRRYVRQRFWACGEACRKNNELEHVRSRLTCELGRVPERHELLAELGKKITNPAMIIDMPRKLSLGDHPRADADQDTPDRIVQDAELRKIMLNVLDKRDRKLLRATLRGVSESDIAREQNISRERVRQLMNGVLWKLRANKRLAEALGFDAEFDKPLFQQRTAYSPLTLLGPARRLAAAG